jgi:hypothetical protein
VFGRFVYLSSTWNLMFDHFVDLACTQKFDGHVWFSKSWGSK